jgi:hypothetical protein
MRAEKEIRRQLARFDTTSDIGKCRLATFIQRVSDRRNALHIKPEFTPEVVGVCKQIVAFGAALLGLAIAFFPRLTDVAPFWQSVVGAAALLTVNLTGIALFVLVWFFVQARSRYPFLYLERMGNAMPFFYYQTLDRHRSYKPLPSTKGILSANRFFLTDLRKFARNLVDEDEDVLTRARHELQQYYLLIVYQGYLDQYEMQLVHIFVYASLASLLSILIVWLFLWI